MASAASESRAQKRLRWWPAVVVVVLAVGSVIRIRSHRDWSFQQRNAQTLIVSVSALVLLLVWWLVWSRVRWRLRLASLGGLGATICIGLILFKFAGFSGDLKPLLKFRWTGDVSILPTNSAGRVIAQSAGESRAEFSQFLGPSRSAILSAPVLAPDWSTRPPQVLWRHALGAGWSGWAVVGARAVTQEQRGAEECSTCYETLTGKLLWSHAERAHYQSALAGEGPRCTPTIVSNRVFTLGATGILNCLELATGRQLWSRNLVQDASSRVPDWGFSGSPLVCDGRVVVSAGGLQKHSLLAYRVEKGEPAWSAGVRPASYSSPYLATLAGMRQIIAFNSRHITAHDPVNGAVLWEYPWGNGQPQVAEPVVVDSNHVVFSSGYGVGSELLELTPGERATLTPRRVWRSRKMKAKFANLVHRDGFLYGLDDGVLACLDLKDGSQRWKEGRYGHGQGLLVRDLFLLMAESGELVLLQPTPDAPNELHRFRVFTQKTWNPIALAGELLLVRNDQEAACLRLAVRP